MKGGGIFSLALSFWSDYGGGKIVNETSKKERQ